MLLRASGWIIFGWVGVVVYRFGCTAQIEHLDIYVLLLCVKFSHFRWLSPLSTSPPHYFNHWILQQFLGIRNCNCLRVMILADLIADMMASTPHYAEQELRNQHPAHLSMGVWFHFRIWLAQAKSSNAHRFRAACELSFYVSVSWNAWDAPLFQATWDESK
jgi:hypothetical protein